MKRASSPLNNSSVERERAIFRRIQERHRRQSVGFVEDVATPSPAGKGRSQVAGVVQRAASGPPWFFALRLPRCRRRTGRGGQDGFTLIELGVVLLVIGVVLSMAIPRFRDSSHARLVAATRKLAVTYRFLRHEAILNGRTYRMNYDLDQQRYWITSSNELEGTDSFQPEEGILAREIALVPPVGISDVVLPNLTGKLFEGISYTHFYPDGYVDLTVVHLDNGQEAFTVRIDSLTGRVYVLSGYQDFDFSA